MDLGQKIKQLRNLCNLTQEELANRCELTKSYISQLENDKTSPSISTLSLILEVLGTDLGHFFYEEQTKKIVFTEEDQNETEYQGYQTTWLIPPSQKLMMEPIIVTIQPGGVTLEDRPHEGEEFGYVLKGTIEVIYGSQQERCLVHQGFYYPTDKTHYIKNIGAEEAVILWVSCPPNF